MPGLEYEFRECQNAACRLRFPAPVDGTVPVPAGSRVHECPKCGSPTRLAARASLPNELGSASRANHVETSGDAVLLDNIRSAWNVGSILRTADGAGLQRVYLCGITPTPDHPRVDRTALGAQNNLHWHWHANSLLLARELLQQGYRLWALEATPGAEPLTAMARQGQDQSVVLIVGNEIAGVDPGLLELAEHTYAIPMRGIKQSLNAAVAFGIAAYELTRLAVNCS